MLKKLVDTTAASPLGLATGHKLHDVAGGTWKNRRVALLMTAPNTISLYWADSPYRSWSSALEVASDVADTPFDSSIDPDGNIVVAYTDSSSSHLVTRRLSIGSNGWTVGSKVTVYDGAAGFNPSVTIDGQGKIWLAWGKFVAPTSIIYAKSSTDGGTTWGSGPSDNGEQLSSAANFVWPRLIVDSANLHSFVAYGASHLAMRTRALSGGSWTSETQVYAAPGITSDFDIALTGSGG